MMSKQAILFSFFIFVAQNAGALVDVAVKDLSGAVKVHTINYHFNDTKNVGACVFSLVRSNKGFVEIDARCMEVGSAPYAEITYSQFWEPGGSYRQAGSRSFVTEEYVEAVRYSLKEKLSGLIKKRICEDYFFAILTYGIVSSSLQDYNPWGVEFSYKEKEECEKKAIALKESRKAAEKENQKCLRQKQKSGEQKKYCRKKSNRKNRYKNCKGGRR